MDLSPGERILYGAVGDVLDVPRSTHKELTNKRASVMLTEKIEGKLQIEAPTDLVKWAFIPCFQQMFSDTNALPMGLHATQQMVLDFCAHVHRAKIRILHEGDDLCHLALLRGGEAVPYRGAKRQATPRLALRLALDVDDYNAGDLAARELLATLGEHHFQVVDKTDGNASGEDAEATIDAILASLRDWMGVIDDHQDLHVILDTFLRSLQDAGMDIVLAR